MGYLHYVHLSVKHKTHQRVTPPRNFSMIMSLITKLTSSVSSDVKSWVIFISCIIILIIIIIPWIYHNFRRQSKTEKAFLPSSDDRSCYEREYSTSSSLVDNRLTSSSGSDDQLINMVPLECGVTRPRYCCGKYKVGYVHARRSYYSSCRRFSLDEIRGLTNDLDRRDWIGNGWYGSCRRVNPVFLLDGTPVVLKDLTCTRVEAEEFISMVEVTSNLTHRNVVKTIGICVVEVDFHTRRIIIVSEYVDNGNLHEWLHVNNVGEISPLTWKTRMKIILGIAKGLAYIHEDAVPNMALGRLQSCKILLDSQWRPKISGLVLARLLPPALELSDVAYLSRNWSMTSDTAKKEDVYSFGILVMEIISGRNPAYHDRPLNQDLMTWLKSLVLNQNYEEILDPKILQLPPMKELKRVLLIVLRCTDLDAENRPTMVEVIHMLEPRNLLLNC